MKKIYTLANMAKGMMLAALLAVGTTALAQNVSGNTENGTVEGTENGTVEGTENGTVEGTKMVLLKAMKMVATRMKLSLLLQKALGSNL